jgi:hypothetical protein
MQFKLKEEELAALINGNSNRDPLQQLLLMKTIFGKEDDKKKDDEGHKPMFFFGYEIKKRKKESTGSLVLWCMLALLAFSPYVNIVQDWMVKSLQTALH